MASDAISEAKLSTLLKGLEGRRVSPLVEWIGSAMSRQSSTENVGQVLTEVTMDRHSPRASRVHTTTHIQSTYVPPRMCIMRSCR